MILAPMIVAGVSVPPHAEVPAPAAPEFILPIHAQLRPGCILSQDHQPEAHPSLSHSHFCLPLVVCCYWFCVLLVGTISVAANVVASVGCECGKCCCMCVNML